MIHRIGAGLRQLFHGSLYGGYARQPRQRVYASPIRGNMRSVIVVKPSNSMFSEAVFILSDEYIRSHTHSQGELMQQANEAVAEYASSLSGGFIRGHRRGIYVLVAAAFAAAILIMWLLIGIQA